MIKMETKEKTYLTIGIFILLSSIGTIYYIAQDSPYDVFYCNYTNQVGMCHKISHDSDGLSKRCYYDLNNTRKYSYCKTGWIEFTEEIIGNVSETSIGSDMNLEQDKILVLKNLGIEEPIIRPCKKINEFKCKSKIYQKGGINRDFKIITKYCIEYNITEVQGDCLNWTNETCIDYQMINVTGDCIDWKILNKDEINSEAIKYAEEEFGRIYRITLQRQNRVSELLSDEIILNIK